MAVTSTTIGGVNCWQFSGAVTQSEITTAWAALLVNGEYTPARALYFDNTCDMTAVQGGFSVNMTTGTQSIILHTGRNKTNTILKYWNIRYTAGLSVGNRTLRCVGWNGTSFVTFSGSSSETDGLGMYGGSHTYAVAGNPGGGDPRYLDEFAFGLIGGGLQISSASFTEQELQPDIRGQKDLNDVTFTRCFGFPQVTGPSTRISMWRCYENTMHPSQKPVRLYDRASVFYIDSTLRRNNAAITSNLIDAYGSSTGFNVAFAALNNWQDETWFGVSKTSLSTANWATGNVGYGGVLKKLQFVGVGAAGTVKCYDSRSTTVPQRGTFVGNTTFDGLAAGTSTTTDANGKVWIALVGADLNASSQITRYTGQKYTFQAFGYRVSVTSVDMTAGGDDNTAPYTPVVPVVQPGLSRTQAAINAATTINTFQQFMEELHVFAIGLSGAASYAGAYGGNLFDFSDGTLTTSFDAINVDPTATSKISFNSAVNILTVKSALLTADAVVKALVNTGAVNFYSGATIKGTYTANGKTYLSIKERTGRPISTYVTINGVAEGGTFLPEVVNYADGIVNGWVPLATERKLAVSPTDQIRIAASYYGSKPAVFNFLGSEIDKFTLDFDRENAIDTTISTVTRDAIAANFTTLDAPPNIIVQLYATLEQYSPSEVIAGLDYYIVSRGYIIHAALNAANNANLYALSTGTVVSYSPAYKLSMAEWLPDNSAPIEPSEQGYFVPLVVYYQNPSTGAKSKMTLLNGYGAELTTARWAQSASSLPATEKTAIATEVKILIEASTVLAKETTVASRSSQASNDAIKAKVDTLTNGPTTSDIKTAMEAAGSKLDKAMKAAQSAEDQTA